MSKFSHLCLFVCLSVSLSFYPPCSIQAHPDVPALFVMNVQFPREEQKMFTDGDGPGASVVFYFKITAATLTELQGPSSERSNALKLLTEWCRVAPEDPAFRGRFKAMGFIDRIQVWHGVFS